MLIQEILDKLPYGPGFLFVDELSALTEEGITGSYTYKLEEFFYPGHFKDHPITPGVILVETMAQIGLVCLGIFLLGDKCKEIKLAFTSADVNFLKPVLPGDRVTVSSEKEYFRFGKLKCKVEMRNEAGEKVCTGVLSGMVKI